MSLISICQNALKGISGFSIPSTFYGNLDATASLIVAVANESGQDLEKEIRWQELISEHTFATVIGTATYALPTGFRAFADMSQWNRTTLRRLSGPVPSTVYQWLKSGLTVSAAGRNYFMIRGNLFTIYPTPTAVQTIAFDYYDKRWVTKQIDSSFSTSWTADLDTSRIDEDLITADVKWRFLQAKGMPFETEYLRYETIKSLLSGDNGGRDSIRMGGPVASDGNSNMPDTGYGA